MNDSYFTGYQHHPLSKFPDFWRSSLPLSYPKEFSSNNKNTVHRIPIEDNHINDITNPTTTPSSSTSPSTPTSPTKDSTTSSSPQRHDAPTLSSSSSSSSSSLSPSEEYSVPEQPRFSHPSVSQELGADDKHMFDQYTTQRAQRLLLATSNMSEFKDTLNSVKTHLKGADMSHLFDHAQTLRDEHFFVQSKRNGLRVISLSGESNRCWVRAAWAIILATFIMRDRDGRRHLVEAMLDNLDPRYHDAVRSVFRYALKYFSNYCRNNDILDHSSSSSYNTTTPSNTRNNNYHRRSSPTTVAVAMADLLNNDDDDDEKTNLMEILETVSIDILRRAGYTDATDVTEYNAIGMGSADMMDCIWRATDVHTVVIHTGVPDTLDSATLPAYTALYAGTLDPSTREINNNNNNIDNNNNNNNENDKNEDDNDFNSSRYKWLCGNKLYDITVDVNEITANEYEYGYEELPPICVVDHLNVHFNLVVPV